MSTANDIITSARYDLKIASTDTDRNNELIDYMNRCVKNIIVPNLIGLSSDLGVKEFLTTETVANNNVYSLPSDFKTPHMFWIADIEHSGTAQAGASAAITLASAASSTDDAYNGWKIRITGGTGEDQQKLITDYNGTTKAATVESSWTTNPDSTSAYAIFNPGNISELEKKNIKILAVSYSDVSKPEAYAIMGTDLLLGNIPDDVYVLGGFYFYKPAALSATGSTIPYNEFFDEQILEYTIFKGLNRDEYNLKIEAAFLEDLGIKIKTMIRRRGKKFQMAKIRGSSLAVED